MPDDAATGLPPHRRLRPLLRSPFAVTALGLALVLAAMALVTTRPETAFRSTSHDASPPGYDRDWMGSTLPDNERDDGGDGDGSGEQRVKARAVEGVDVSSYQGEVDWAALRESGVRWAYIKATEGTSYQNPDFAQQREGADGAGLLRGSYHFALPDRSSGAAQARYFTGNGGAWKKDGRTLPPVLDIEYNPYGDSCYGKSASAMTEWLRAFSRQTEKETGRAPVIYTSTSFWKRCTGNSDAFAESNPLWIARYASSPGALPGGWRAQTFWQYTASGDIVGDHNRFNGSLKELKALARG